MMVRELNVKSIYLIIAKATISASLLATIAASTSQATIIALGAPDALLFGSNFGLNGTVLADQTTPFSVASNPYTTGTGTAAPTNLRIGPVNVRVPFYLSPRYIINSATVGHIGTTLPDPLQGTLRSVVVQNTAGTLDFYYQLANTSDVIGVSTDIFRLTIDGFAGIGLPATEVDYRSNGLAGITGAGAFTIGNQAPVAANRLTNLPDSFGFEFGLFGSSFISQSRNVSAGETSNFLFIRTNETSYFDNRAVISGRDTAVAHIFAPVGLTVTDPATIPEPSTALMGIALIAVMFTEPRRRFR